jgi:16S rRNA (guanine(527)-N(7))-methyltransferase RsmG
MRDEFVTAISALQTSFGIEIPAERIGRLADYYELILEHNAILHLVGPSTAEEFAHRHILESLTLLEHLPAGARFADVGAGGGLPSVPCLIVRDDLKALLIESKEKKTAFLEIAVGSLGLAGRAEIVNKQFQEVDPANCESITCRALDKFTEKLAGMLRWRKRRQALLFGGPNLRDALLTQKATFTERLMPMSVQRYLFVVNR